MVGRCGLLLRVGEQLRQLERAPSRPLPLLDIGHPEEDLEPRKAERSVQGRTVMATILALAQHRLRELPRLAIVIRGGTIRRHLLGLARRFQQRRHGFAVVVAARVVVRQERGSLAAGAAGLGLEQLADALVELAALPQQQPLVGDLLREALAEAELVARQQPSCDAPAAAALAARRARAATSTLSSASSVASCGLRNCRPSTAATCTTRLAAARARSRRAAMTSWTVPGSRISADRAASSSHAAVPGTQAALLEQRAHDLLGEEGTALGLARRCAASSSPGSAPPRRARTTAATASSAERAQTSWRERRRHAPRHGGTSGRCAHHQHHLRRRDAAGQLLEHLPRRLVDPVQVLDDHHHRRALGLGQHEARDRVERLALELAGRHGPRAARWAATGTGRARDSRSRCARRPCRARRDTLPQAASSSSSMSRSNHCAQHVRRTGGRAGLHHRRAAALEEPRSRVSARRWRNS